MSANQRSSHVYTISHDSLWRPLATALRRPSPGNPQNSVVNSKRSFIDSPRVRSEFLDDIGETENVGDRRRVKRVADRRHDNQVQSISLMQSGQGAIIRNKQSSSPSPPRPRSAQPDTSPAAIAAAELKKAEELKAAAELQAAAELKLALRKIQSIRSKFDTLCMGTSQLVSKYVHLKYQHMADELSQGAAKIDSWEKERHEIALAARTRLEYEHARQHLEKGRRQIEESLSMAQEMLLTIKKEVDELTEPRLSARHRVETYLAPLSETTNIIKELSTLSHEVKYHQFAIEMRLKFFLERMPSQSGRLWPIYWKLAFERKAFRNVVHRYRHCYIQRTIYQNYGESWPFRFLLNAADMFTIRKNLQQHKMKMIKFERARDKLQAQGRDPFVIAPKPGFGAGFPDHYLLGYVEQMEHFYFPKSEAQCHPLLDLHKRQLDVMAPFLLARDLGGNIGHIVSALMERAGGPLGSRLGRTEKDRYLEDLARCSATFRDLRSHHITVSEQIWQLNWMLLKAEDKLATLGMPKIDVRRGERLTENRALFRQWAKRMYDVLIGATEIISIGMGPRFRRRAAAMPESQGRTHARPRQRIRGRPRAPSFKSPSRTPVPTRGRPTKPLNPRKARRSRQRDISRVPALGSNTAKGPSDSGPPGKLLLPGHGTSPKSRTTGPWKTRYRGRAPDDTENASTSDIPGEDKDLSPWTNADLQRKAREALIAAINQQDGLHDPNADLQWKAREALIAAINQQDGPHDPRPARRKRLPRKVDAKHTPDAKSQQRLHFRVAAMKLEQDDHSNSEILGKTETLQDMVSKPRELVTPINELKGLDILAPLERKKTSRTVSPEPRHAISAEAQSEEGLAAHINDPDIQRPLGRTETSQDMAPKPRDMAEIGTQPTTSRRMAPRPKVSVGRLRRGRLAVKRRIHRSPFS